ncbi:Glycosyltransferase involved in cell wall bisynthesis [Luteibacter sp. UNCMF331Sha3.1]|uniref:glycosyltransferase family 2 protein n=1 Tax=Luteibacter sp. UNCMF331Sha3.1 TaxID=1502760 RepID=UPI0008ABF035|nr:glycosyltransferase family 2 protein [Luteibacter sp. UNCMF331Sha3.1]SEM33923.1 Glycosyltransferase involved in cell wall bisynthesis [Luteibacter sp. UNCMF331Sha3.1]
MIDASVQPRVAEPGGAQTVRKLVIQIPCLNEASTLHIALSALPRKVPGFESVEWLIVDDGSTDHTARVAREAGVDHVIRHPTNRGLAAAFMTGLEASLKLGADVIVNTDADNQYDARDIPLLTQPILAHEADLVIGSRPIEQTEHFSWTKRKLQRLGSWAVRVASHTNVADAPSGFRAISREAAMRLNVFGQYTYTLETIIQAGLSGLRVACVPIRTHPDLRPSRLVKSIRSYVQRSLGTIIRVFVTYRPLVTFLYAGGLIGLVGLAAGLRFVYFYLSGEGEGHVQSVVLAALCLILSMLLTMMGLIADLISVNRKLLEDVLLRVRHMEETNHAASEASRGDQ